jgi:hypothetical protein
MVLGNFLNICQGQTHQSQMPSCPNLDDDEPPPKSKTAYQFPFENQHATTTLKKNSKKNSKKQLGKWERLCPGITTLLAKLNNALKASGYIDIAAIINENELNEKIEGLINAYNGNIFILAVTDGIAFFPLFFNELKIAKIVARKKNFTERTIVKSSKFSDESVRNALKKLRGPWWKGEMLLLVHWNNLFLIIVRAPNPFPVLNKIPPESWQTSRITKAAAFIIASVLTYYGGQALWRFLTPFAPEACENLAKTGSKVASTVTSGVQSAWKKTKDWTTKGVKKIGEFSIALDPQNEPPGEIPGGPFDENVATARGLVALGEIVGNVVEQRLSENMAGEKNESIAPTSNPLEESSTTPEDSSIEEVASDYNYGPITKSFATVAAD